MAGKVTGIVADELDPLIASGFNPAGGQGGVWKTSNFLSGAGTPKMVLVKGGPGTLVLGNGNAVFASPITDVLYGAGGNSGDSAGTEVLNAMLAAGAPVARDSGIKVYLDVVYNHTGESPAPVIHHGTTVLAWARVDGVSPLAGKAPANALVAPPDPAADVGTTVQGTNGNDVMVQGNVWWETLLGLGGNDVFIALADKGGQAPDTWDGGDGINWAHFSNATTPVDVDLASGQASRAYPDAYWGTVHQGFINLINIQNVVGSAHGDRIIGDAGANELWGHDGDDLLHGGAGDDVLNGGLGNDVLQGGPGADTLTGGPGDDTFRWAVGDIGLDVVEDFQLDVDRVQFGDGFLVTANPKNSLLVVGAGTDSILMADTIEAGWQEIALFRRIDNDDLIAAINNGVLFGYEAGPLADGAPGGLAGPARPDIGRGGTFKEFTVTKKTDLYSVPADELALIADFNAANAHSGGVTALMGDGSVRGLRDSIDTTSWSAEPEAGHKFGLTMHYDSGVF